MEQITRGERCREAARVGVDLAKQVIQVHAVDARGRVITSRALRRDQFLPWCAQLPTGCLVAMEASSSAHHWGCQRSAQTGHPRIGIYRPPERVGGVGQDRRLPASAGSAFTGQFVIGI